MKIYRVLLPLLAIVLSGCNGATSEVPSLSSSDSSNNSTVVTSESINPSTSNSTPLPSEIGTSEQTGPLPRRLSNTKTLNEYQLEFFDQSGMPSIGEYDVLVVPVEIYGTSFASDYKNRLELLFNGTSIKTGWESVASYYRKSSYGQLDITFDVLDKITTSANRDKTFIEGRGEIGDEYAVADAFAKIDGVDFTKYDYNDDGYIDGVFFVYSVDYNYEVDPWWAWVYTATYFSDYLPPTDDGMRLGYYMWASYSFMEDDTLSVEASVNAETFIHEMGHMLAMPDLYSTTYDAGPLGGWDMMDYNSGDHGPMTKLLWGWINPLVAEEKATYSINLAAYSTDDGHNSTLLIPRSNANLEDGDVFDEYLLIMYYTPAGLYRAHSNTNWGLDQSGVAIYRVDARLGNSPSFWDYFLNNNQGRSPFLVELLEADYSNSIPSNNFNISNNDILSSGRIDLGSYSWNQGGEINVIVEVDELSTNNANLSITLYD